MMKIINTLYNEPPDEIEQIVKMTDTEYEQIKSDRALLEEAVRLLKISYRHLPQLYGETEDELLQGQIQNFLARAKERGIG